MKKLKELKVGFIGFGNMAQAIADGLLRQNTLTGSQMCACAKDYDKLCANTSARGMAACKDAAEVADKSDLIFIAVKPYMVEPVLASIKDKLAGKIIVSVAVNLSNDYFEDLLPGTHHISTLPNTPVAVGEGIFILERAHTLSAEEFDLVRDILSTISLVQTVDPAHLGIAGTISGCGPAFASMFIEALGDAAVLHGLPRAVSYQLAGQMIAGTGKLLVESEQHPGAMKDAVCSPGGTTIVGVTTLERKGLRTAVIDAVDAVMKK